MYELIKTGELRIPSFLSWNAKALIRAVRASPARARASRGRRRPPHSRGLSQLLVRDPTRRLGAGPGDGADIRSHAFFEGVDWDEMMKRKIPPPFVPSTAGAADTGNFDEEFTLEPAVDSVVPTSDLDRIAKTGGVHFTGFTYAEKSALG